VSRHNHQRLADILTAADAITHHLTRGDLTDGLVFDAVRVRLIEIGEAVNGIAPELLAQEPDIPWRDITGMRNYLAHRYFDTAHAIVHTTITDDLPPSLPPFGDSLIQARRDPPRTNSPRHVRMPRLTRLDEGGELLAVRCTLVEQPGRPDSGSGGGPIRPASAAPVSWGR
jgi:uncharacterized protein with HEPN domain